MQEEEKQQPSVSGEQPEEQKPDPYPAEEAVAPEGAPTEISYRLTEKEIQKALYAAGLLKNPLAGNLIKTILLLCLMVVFAQQYLFTSAPNVTLGIVLIAISAAVGIAVWIVPSMNRSVAKEKANTAASLSLIVYENMLLYRSADTERRYLLNGDCSLLCADEMTLFFGNGGRLIVIPDRAFASPQEATLVRERLIAGTHPRAV